MPKLTKEEREQKRLEQEQREKKEYELKVKEWNDDKYKRFTELILVCERNEIDYYLEYLKDPEDLYLCVKNEFSKYNTIQKYPLNCEYKECYSDYDDFITDINLIIIFKKDKQNKINKLNETINSLTPEQKEVLKEYVDLDNLKYKID